MSVPWLRELAGAIELRLHVQPGARRTEVAGLHGDALKVHVAAAPVDGCANETLLRFLATSFGVPLKQIAIVRGAKARNKTVRIDAPIVRADRQWSAAERGTR